MAKDYKLKLYDEQIDNNHPDAKERGIRQDGLRDWRDRDIYLVLDGTKVYSGDEQWRNHGGAVEPDYSRGWWLQNQSTGQIVLGPFTGPCPSPFRESLLEGREMVGVIVARDFQMHG
jgi:hypothetical protein